MFESMVSILIYVFSLIEQSIQSQILYNHIRLQSVIRKLNNNFPKFELSYIHERSFQRKCIFIFNNHAFHAHL